MTTPSSLNTLPNPIVDYFAATNAPLKTQSPKDTKEETLVPVDDPNQLDFIFVNPDFETDEPLQVKILKTDPPPAPPKMPVVTAPIPDKAAAAVKRTRQSQKSADAPMPLTSRAIKAQLLHIRSPKGPLVPVRMFEKGDAGSLLVVFKGKVFRAVQDINYLEYGFIRKGNKYFHPLAPFEQVECVLM